MVIRCKHRHRTSLISRLPFTSYKMHSTRSEYAKFCSFSVYLLWLSSFPHSCSLPVNIANVDNKCFSGILIPGHQSSCFWVGTLLQWTICFHVSVKAWSFVSSSISTFVNAKSVTISIAREKHPDTLSHALFPSLIFSQTHTHTYSMCRDKHRQHH